MGSVLRVVAASALIATACAKPVSAQTGFASMIDHVHLAAPDPIKAVEWYRKNLGGQPTTEGTDRLIFGETRVIFQRNDKPIPSAGSVVDHIGFSVKDVDAAMKAMEADGAKIEGPAREVPGLGEGRLRCRPIRYASRNRSGSRAAWPASHSSTWTGSKCDDGMVCG